MILKKVIVVEKHIQIQRKYCCDELKQSRIAEIMDVNFEHKTVGLDLRQYLEEGKYIKPYFTIIKYCPYCGLKFQFVGDK